MLSIKLSDYRIRIQFDNSVLVAEQNHYTTKIVNAYIVYDLNDWPKNPFNNFKLKNCLFGATNIRKNSNKSQWLYTGYTIVFGGGGLWSFGNDFARNVVIFSDHNTLSSHADNHKNNFLVISEGPTYDINRSFGAKEKNV